MSHPSSNRALFACACAGMALFGVTLVIPGLLFGLASVRARLEISDAVRQGNLQSLLMMGVFAATVFIGPLIDRYGTKIVLAVGAAMLACGFTGLALIAGYEAGCVTTFAAGLGGGVVNMATNVVVSTVYPQDRGSKLNALGVFFGAGALSLPLLSAAGAWFTAERLLGLAAAFAALVAVACATLEFPPQAERGAGLREMLGVARYPAVLLFAFLLFFESSNEMALIGWTTTWATAAGSSVRSAELMLATFQVGMMLGRIFAAAILRVVTKVQLVFACAAGSVVAGALLLASRTVAATWVAVALLGLCFSPIYQTVLALAGDRYQRFAGTVFGLLFSIALIGSFVSPLVIGRIAQFAGVRTAAVVPLAGAAAICVLIASIVRRTRAPVAAAARQ